MVYAHNFWRVQFGGPLFVNEEWSCNINMGIPNGATDGAPDPTELTAIRTAINTWFISANANNSNAAKLAYVKANEIGEDGKYTDPFASNEYLFPTPAVGGNVTPAPAQHSVCLSWVTARARGAGAHGRIYPPTGLVTIDAAGLISAGVAGNMATAAKTLLDALNVVSVGTRVIVASQGGVTGPEAHVPVTAVRVGRLPDTQRRRRETLAETYTAPLALSP